MTKGDADSEKERQLITIYQVAQIDPDENSSLTHQLLDRRKQVTSETGYMMKFAGKHHRNLTPFDILTLPGKSYPVSVPALNSLPPHIRTELDSKGAVQLVGIYNPDTGAFEQITMEWDNRSIINRAAELVSLGLTETPALRYVAIEETGAYTKEQWATIRGVGDGAIGNSIREVETKLDERFEDFDVENARESTGRDEDDETNAGNPNEQDTAKGSGSRSVMVGESKSSGDNTGSTE